MSTLEDRAARQSMLIYTGVSLAMALLFLTATFLTGKSYTAVARVGGMIWVFVLSMIISMPIVIPKIRKKVLG
jgi:hypothetical protein